MLKVDLHVHTPACDGFSSVEKLVKQAKKLGLSAFAVCDHNMCTPLPDCGFPLIPAIEVSTTKGHIVGLYIDPAKMNGFTRDNLPAPGEAIEAIHAAGGVAVLAHPFEFGHITEDDLDGFTPDFIEINNSRAVLKHRDANARAAAYAQKRGIPQTGGSDAHCAAELGGSYTEVDCDDVSELEAAIRAGKTRSVFVRRSRWRYKGRAELSAVTHVRLGVRRTLRAPLYFAYTLIRDLFDR